jgi:hypothetical protein
MAQRAYFLDFNGGLWSWGSKAVDARDNSTTKNYRMDTSEITGWTTNGQATGNPGIRRVAKDGDSRNAYTALPAPFRVGDFPGKGKDGAAKPATVGIAMVSGNRNNPLDYLYNTDNKPAQYRATVVFDRRDSRAWSLDTQDGPDTGILKDGIIDFSQQNEPNASVITPGGSDFYLAPSSGKTYFGYYINFPGPTADKFLPKGIDAPLVVSGSLFYSYFTPTAGDPCTGGSGTTSSWFICDVMKPVADDTRETVACKSGLKFTWSGVASGYVAYGSVGAIQSGVVPIGGTVPPGTSATKIEIQTIKGKRQNRHPKARVWRTVQ